MIPLRMRKILARTLERTWAESPVTELSPRTNTHLCPYASNRLEQIVEHMRLAQSCGGFGVWQTEQGSWSCKFVAIRSLSLTLQRCWEFQLSDSLYPK